MDGYKFFKQRNNTVPESFWQKFAELICHLYGCVTTGELTGYAQASCKRCGHRNQCASDGVPEWQAPEWIKKDDN